jgi:hypothetical protein
LELDTLVDIITIFSTIFAGIGLIYTSITFKRQSHIKEIELAENIISSLLEIEETLADLLREKPPQNIPIDMEEDEYERKIKNFDRDKKTWISVFSNKFEWISFLIDKKQIKNKEIICYFESTFMKSYEQLSKLVSDETLKKFSYINKVHSKYKNQEFSCKKIKND